VIGCDPLAQRVMTAVPEQPRLRERVHTCITAYANRWAMITRPGAYQNRPCPPPSVRSRSERPATAPVHHRHSLPGTVATFAR
jgi:hypothetical protein